MDALRSIAEIFDFDGHTSTHGVNPSATGNLSKVGRCRIAGCLIWLPENGRHEAVSGGSPELPGVGI
ncbi:hypothetical protein, partial [Stenotrophomonas sp. 3(2025)]|uniref:hypothetical protein n=1 Tax=Stenotrophomonas sp. 3(2025) TaxID=3456023 RepID=UPI0040447DB5